LIFRELAGLRFPLMVFAGLFVFSVFGLVLAQGPTVRRIFFFPPTVGDRLATETRQLRVQLGLENSVATVVDDALLGPMKIQHRRILPKNTRANTVLVRNGEVTVDLSEHCLMVDNEVNLSLAEGIQVLEKTVLFNFREARGMAVTVNGQVPGKPAYQGNNR
jgi:hypothetical protein